MSFEQIVGIGTIMSLVVAGMWAVYSLLSSRVTELHKDLIVVRENYVRRDDFLRVIDRFEKKLDDHLKLISKRE